MLKMKACPRGKGDLIIERDRYTWSEECLQCGFERELKNLDGNYSAIGAMSKAGAVAVEDGISKKGDGSFIRSHSPDRFIDKPVRLRQKNEQNNN